jgi:arsenate reductase
MLRVFQYPNCSTCKKALRWLDAQGIAYRSTNIVEQPPSLSLLKKARKSGVPLTKLFNTSGQSYRAGNFKAKLATMSEAEALDALAADGKLVKRPFVMGEGVVLLGFREEDYSAALID